MFPYFCVFIKFMWHVVVDHDNYVASWIQSTSSYHKVHFNYTVFNLTTAQLTITIYHFSVPPTCFSLYIAILREASKEYSNGRFAYVEPKILFQLKLIFSSID